jgi:hypothetical protein
MRLGGDRLLQHPLSVIEATVHLVAQYFAAEFCFPRG